MASDNTYNGWTNYETWIVNLWMDNEEGSYRYWREIAQASWNETADKRPNQFMDHDENARSALAEQLKSHFDDDSEHEVFSVAANTVYADLLSGALSEVNWYEIAQHLLEDVDKDTEDDDDDN